MVEITYFSVLGRNCIYSFRSCLYQISTGFVLQAISCLHMQCWLFNCYTDAVAGKWKNPDKENISRCTSIAIPSFPQLFDFPGANYFSADFWKLCPNECWEHFWKRFSNTSLS